MKRIIFKDDTPPINVEVLLKAESIFIVFDGSYFYIVNASRVDEIINIK